MDEDNNQQRENAGLKLWATVLSAAREIVAVIVAILLALAINEWWEDHERTQRKEELTDKLYAELQENLSRLRESHAHHSSQLQIIRDSVDGRPNLTAEDYVNVHRELYRRGVFKPALLTDTNWEIAKLTDLISYMDMEDLQAFTRIFALQQMHKDQWEQNSQAQVFADTLEDPRKLVEFYANTLNETWWAEKTLLEALEKHTETNQKSEKTG